MSMDRDNDGFDDSEELKVDILKDGWENRRAIAWISFLYCLSYPFLCGAAWVFDPDLANTLVGLATATYTLCGANLVAYFTFSSWETIKGGQ